MKRMVILFLSIFIFNAPVYAKTDTNCVKPIYTLIADHFLDFRADTIKQFEVNLGESACFDKNFKAEVIEIGKNSVTLSIKFRKEKLGVVRLKGQRRFRNKNYLIKRIHTEGSKKAHVEITLTEQFKPLPAATPIANDNLVCYMLFQPVCGKKNGSLKTYSNDCFAEIAGAQVVSQGECK